jgi:penicillin-binding protein 1A
LRRIAAGCALAGLALGAFGLARLVASLPPLDRIEPYRPALPTIVLDRNGEVIGEFAAQRRRLVRLDEVPPRVIDAFLAAEDAGFYGHWGLDLPALVRAAWVNFRAGGIRQGGSTITQQLAKHLLPAERTIGRKLRDMLLALQIEWRLGKDRILEIYLNEIYLGNGAYGVAQAARSYFDKDLADLSVSEAALIAGLTKAPSAFAPTVNPAAAEERRLYVLDRMYALGRIGPASWRSARADRPPLATPRAREASTAAAYFVEDVRRILFDRLGADAVLRGGYRVETPLDLELQRSAVAALRRGIEQAERRRKRAPGELAPIEGAIVALDVATGDVLALVGGYDFARSQFDRATQARRQPGSAFKPFVYGAAIEAGHPLGDTLYDVQVSLRDPKTGRRWRPRNAGGLRGAVPMHEALARSLNNATVRLAIEVGVPRVVDFARRVGIVAPLAEDLGLALGSSGVSPLELTSAFGTIAGGGVRNPPRFVTRVRDRDGAVVLADLGSPGSAEAARPSAALSPVDAYLVTHLLSGAIRKGYGTAHQAASLDAPLAGKTGSTNDGRDAWFVGFSPQVVAGVWIGDDAMAPLGAQATGSRLALPVWIEFMKTALARDSGEHAAFPIPEGVGFRARGALPHALGRPVRRSKAVAVAKPVSKIPIVVRVPPGPLDVEGAGPLIEALLDTLPREGRSPPLR